MSEINHDGPVIGEGGWMKSSFSASNGACVEVRPGDIVDVRHSKFPNAGQVSFTLTEWRAFIKGAKAGQFDF